VYTKRHIEEVLKAAINEKGALCVTGARQVGKSTVLKALFEYFATNGALTRDLRSTLWLKKDQRFA